MESPSRRDFSLVDALYEDVEEDKDAEEDLCQVAWHQISAGEQRRVDPIGDSIGQSDHSEIEKAG